MVCVECTVRVHPSAYSILVGYSDGYAGPSGGSCMYPYVGNCTTRMTKNQKMMSDISYNACDAPFTRLLVSYDGYIRNERQED
jgi:hypothetical protein